MVSQPTWTTQEYRSLIPRRAIFTAPFIPFIVLFCRTLETSNPEYLDILAAVIETFTLLPLELPKACKVQLRVFKAMHEVACEYIKASEQNTLGTQRLLETVPNKAFGSFNATSSSSWTLGTMMQDAPGIGQDVMMNSGSLGGPFSSASVAPRMTITAQTSDSGAELGDWWDNNQRMFTMFEDVV